MSTISSETRPQRFWIAVAAAEHARRGAEESGFMQVCHGKGGPLKRLRAGDGVVYYAPTESFRGKDRLQCFVAIGFARDSRVYQYDMGGGFVPFRRDVDYLNSREAPIQPLLDRLAFSRGKRNWGYAFRFGLLEISGADFAVIAAAMGADIGAGLAPADGGGAMRGALSA